MSKFRKIFHTPEEKIPSTEDIIHYLKEEIVSDKKNDLEAEKGSGKELKTNKKKYELEKTMLSEPLVSDAVEGYKLFLNKEKAQLIVNEINQTISNQTNRENKIGGISRIAAVLVIIFMLSGGSYYLFNTISSTEKSSVSFGSKEKMVADTTKNGVSTTKDSMNSLAFKEKDKTIEAESNIKKVLPSELITADYLPAKANSDDSFTKEEEKRSMTEKNDEEISTGINKDIVAPSSSPVVTGKSLKKSDTVIFSKNEIALYEDNKKVIESEENAGNQSTFSSSLRKKKMKQNSHVASSPSNPSNGEMSKPTEDLSNKVGPGKYSLEAGISFYNQNKFKEALENFTGVLQFQPSNQEALYYEGMIHYKSNEFDRSLLFLSKVTKKSRHYDEARWYRANIYLASGKKEEAKKMFKELAKPGNSYSDKAKEELQKIY
ncbi:MAG TPA: tetratricopeptide repeat protein [Cytophagaceae bacterium]|jgi:hypothetical protein|nr:tetratricopeptide repeat protein [Cytophagaceae bacterium]